MLGGTWRTVGSRVTGDCSSAKRCLQSTFLTSDNSPHIHRHQPSSQRRTVVPKALDSAKESDQGLQSDMGDERALNGEEEFNTVKGRSKSAAARACSQAVDGLDKLLCADQQQSQPPHRRKALRALDFAGMIASSPDKVICARYHLCCDADMHAEKFGVLSPCIPETKRGSCLQAVPTCY